MTSPERRPVGSPPDDHTEAPIGDDVHLRETLTCLGEAVIATDPLGRVTFINPVAARLIGRDETDAPGRASAEVLRLLHAKTRQELADPIDRVIRTGASWHLADQTVLQSDHGAETPVEGSANPILDEAGDLLGVVLSFRDASARVRAEAAARQREAELASLNEHLQRAMTETHHRVKNNLQILAGMIDLHVLEDEAMVPAREFRRVQSGIRALAAVHDLLTESTRHPGCADKVSAKSAIEALLRLSADARVGIRVQTAIDENAMLSSRQAASLAIVLSELLNNAMKHAQGTVDVRLTVRESAARLTVCDNGPGFPPDFDPTHTSHTGLEMVSMISRWDLHGRIDFKRRLEGGACVIVTFPYEGQSTPAAIQDLCEVA